MYVIRETFVAKPGMASKLAKLLKEAVNMGTRMKTRVLTDAVGPFNTVTMDTEVKDLGEFEGIMKEYSQRADIQKLMSGYAEMYQTGKREIYRIVE